MHTVIIPCFDRPEYLQVCLQLLQKCEGAKELHYIFALDQGAKFSNREVIDQLMKGWSHEIRQVRERKKMKQSYNLLEAYKYAVEITDKYVFLVEDDIFCAKSFFSWHYSVQREGVFCSIASRLNNNPKSPQTLSLETSQYSKESLYQSLGVCFDKEILKEYVLAHANEDYYSNGRKYIAGMWPDHFLGNNFYEQDGLIRRIHDYSGLEIAYPDYPRCYHAGIWGYHRNGENHHKWTFDQKVNFIYETCFNQHKMQKYNEYGDVFITDLNV